MDSPQTIGEQYAALARANYERDGELAPVLVLHGKEKAAICLMRGSEVMPEAYGRVVASGAIVLLPEYVVTITEVWMKTYERDETRAASVQRGDLERFHNEGDETVKTALMVNVWTMDPTEAATIIDLVVDDKAPTKEYVRTIQTGEMEGYMKDCIIASWTFGLTLTPPPIELNPDLIAMCLSLGGDVHGVIIQAPDGSGDPSLYN